MKVNTKPIQQPNILTQNVIYREVFEYYETLLNNLILLLVFLNNNKKEKYSVTHKYVYSIDASKTLF